jgi:DNA helicase-2/ATP-dependent DNA helicase PcrA
MSADLLTSLNPEQKKAVTQTDGPVLILAGAGSGKTKALTHRIAYLIQEKKISPYNILAVTFTNKAAKEMTDRVQILLNSSHRLAWMGTFHRICLMILRRELSAKAQLERIGQEQLNGVLSIYGPNFSIYDEDDALVVIKRVMNELAIDPKKINPRAVKNFIDGAKNELMTPAGYEPFANGYFAEQVAKIYRRYQAMLVAANAMDFDDIIMNTVLLFQQYPDVLEKYQKQFTYIMIDEYQDTNHAQYMMMKLLANSHQNICVVGDDYQSIYSWRGADFRNILNFEKDYPNTTVIKLEQNYRSTQTILDAAHEIISKNVNRSDKKLWTENPSGLPVTVIECINDEEEADFVISEVRSLYNLYGAYNKVAVLYRTNAQSRLLEESMLRQSIPYCLVGALRFYERKEIKDILAFMKYLVNPNDINALTRVINLPPRGIGEKSVEKILALLNSDPTGLKVLDTMPPKAIEFFQTMERLRELGSDIAPAELIDKIVRQTGYKTYINDGSVEGESRWENVEELMGVAATAESVGQFLEDVALVADIDNYNSSEDAITLMTLHAAKGLEFPVVFMVGMEEGIFPHSRSLMDSSQMEEERRLCYVGMTRAKERLYLLYAGRRMGYGGLVANPKSRFLEELPEHLTELL